ncbi:TenA family transcriptional regulator [Pleomorphomonas sp. PLEO]|uniref:TenA family transcriptional regulator n=1 Tax=Pleomorphomonas sp. PLEO TaxID=3239306 RepID=UPI00351E768C
MSFYDQLQQETSAERQRFLSIPLIRRAIAEGADRETYLAFLGEAYHHVSHTFPLLALAASRTTDERYQDALVEYMEEERGHEKWILDDIVFFGGDADAVRKRNPSPATIAMIGYSYYAIEHVNPYAMLGSVHVLEGMSVLLADKLADRLSQSWDQQGANGFSYLRSHGSLDQSHVAFFRDLVNGFTDPAIRRLIIDNSKIFHHLYGGIFREIDAREGLANAA